MNILALVTSGAGLPNDHDMPLLIDACKANNLAVDVCAWDDPAVDWSCYRAAILRSPWDYSERLAEFLAWCERVTTVTDLVNPLPVVRWNMDKHYLADLAALGVPVVPSRFIEPGAMPLRSLRNFLASYKETDDFVVKPAVGCYSKGVQRYNRTQESDATEHITQLLKGGFSAMLQPYLPSIDLEGETNLIFFDGGYSHAIRKEALLLKDGTVNVPTYNFRAVRHADTNERAVAQAALRAAGAHLNLEQPLLYARVDLIRDNDGHPLVLELEVAEPSLSLPFVESGATLFAQALAKLTNKARSLLR